MKLTIQISLAILLICVAIFGCTKSKLKKNCCKNSTDPYLADSVAVFIPNAFTPNGDGINDIFRPSLQGITEVNFKIYKGENKLVYETQVIGEGWDGEYKGKVAPNLYNFELSLTTIHGIALIIPGEFCVLSSENLDGKLNHCSDCTFGDMIDAWQGFIYESQERTENCN